MFNKFCIKCNKKSFFVSNFYNYPICNNCLNKYKKNVSYFFTNNYKYSKEIILEALDKNKSVSDISEEHYINKKMKEFQEIINSIKFIKPVINKKTTKVRYKTLLNMPQIKNSQIKKNFNLKDFIVLDTETTGLDPTKNTLIEISFIKFVNLEPVECIQSLIKPINKIQKKIEILTKISNKMLTNQPAYYEIIDDFDNFFEDYPIVGYNLEFDLSFLYTHGFTKCFSKSRKYFDVLKICKKCIQKNEVYDYKLSTMCKYFNIYPNTSHRATEDALSTGLIFKELLSSSYLF